MNCHLCGAMTDGHPHECVQHQRDALVGTQFDPGRFAELDFTKGQPMTTKTIQVKQAKPSKADNDRTFEFLQACESIFEERSDPRDEDGIKPIDEDDAFALLDEMWPKVAPCWQRVYFAGHCAIENACDPNLPHLDLKPELRLNSELLEIVRELSTGVLNAKLIQRAQAVVAELDKSTGSSGA